MDCVEIEEKEARRNPENPKLRAKKGRVSSREHAGMPGRST